MPPLITRCDTRANPAARIISANALGRGKRRIDSDQIAIGLGVAHDRAADRRHDVERIELVQRIEPRHVDVGEFEAQEAPAEPQHAVHLLQRHVDARHVADAERDRHRVEAPVRKRQRLGIGVDERHDIVERLRERALAPDAEHVGIDVRDGRARAVPARRDGAERDVAGAARDVEQREIPVSIFGGLIAVTSASFQARCSPADIRSFIRS